MNKSYYYRIAAFLMMTCVVIPTSVVTLWVVLVTLEIL